MEKGGLEVVGPTTPEKNERRRDRTRQHCASSFVLAVGRGEKEKERKRCAFRIPSLSSCTEKSEKGEGKDKPRNLFGRPGRGGEGTPEDLEQFLFRRKKEKRKGGLC